MVEVKAGARVGEAEPPRNAAPPSGGSANHLFAAIARGAERDLAKTVAHLRDGRTLTYRELMERSATVAGALAAMGVAPGDRVAVQVEKSIEAILLYLGAVRAGAVFLPLNTAYTPSEIEYFLTDAEPALFVCDPARRDALEPLATRVGARVATLSADGTGTLTDEVAAAAPLAADVPRAADDLAAILYTSGTTGRSKGAMLTHGNLASNTLTLLDAWRITADDVLIHALPIFHTHGLFVATNSVLMSGASMHFLPKFDARAVIDLMGRATLMMGVPTFYTRLLAEPDLGDAARGMRLFISGSAPLLAETHEAFRTVTGHAILERYGMTETNMTTSNPYEGERRPGTVGGPLPGVEVRVTDPDTAAELARGEIGMIETRGSHVFKGYWRMPEKTAEELRPDGWFITGDLGLIDETGVLTLVGRGKDLIISGGFNVYPKEVEGVIDELPGVVESAVVGVPDPDFGEGVVAVVVREPGASVDAEAIGAALGERLARYKQPKRIAFVDELPRNTMGKVQKNVLRDEHRDAFR